jgi:hypothetical protein
LALGYLDADHVSAEGGELPDESTVATADVDHRLTTRLD